MTMEKHRSLLMVTAVSASCALGLLASANDVGQVTIWDQMVSADGNISMPSADYRKDWTAIGTWAITGDEGKVTGQHVVYTQPESVATFRATGKFPDGAVLIKELLNAETGHLTTGQVAWATDISGWFVMIKDGENRFPSNGLWGNGWGWAYFGADERQQTTTKSFRGECLGCHVPARKTDWIYTKAYPALKSK